MAKNEMWAMLAVVAVVAYVIGQRRALASQEIPTLDTWLGGYVP